VAALVACVAANIPAQALPEGGQVAAGQAAIATSNKAMTITAADRSILNFSKFNIAAGESVRFVQPSSASSVLARATDGTPSEIFGRLEANGRLVLANAAGVYFRSGSVVSVGGLIAAAGNIADADFMRNDGGLAISLTGEVHNAGQISALDGNVALLGQNVINTGSVVAPSGAVVLFSGANILLSEPDGNIAVVRAVSETTGPSLADVTHSVSALAGRPGGAPARRTSGAGVEQAGKVSASSVFLGAADLYAMGVRHTGSTSATSGIRVKTQGKAAVSGEMTAATQTAGAATTIHIQAETVEVAEATIAATGADSGGRVEIKAQEIAVSRSSSIDVSGSNSGNGGNLIVSADGPLSLEGALSSRGGKFGGDGGVISLKAGAPLADSSPLLDLSAPAGQPGKLEQQAPSVPAEREGNTSAASLTFNAEGGASAGPLTANNPTPPQDTFGGVLLLNNSSATGFSDLKIASGNLIVPPTSQPNSAGATSSVTLTGGNPTSPTGAGEPGGSTPPTDANGGVLIVNNTPWNNVTGLTFVGGNLVVPPTGQPNPGTAPQTPTTPHLGTNQANLLGVTGGALTLTTAPVTYTGNAGVNTYHGTIALPGGVSFPAGTGIAYPEGIGFRGLVLSQTEQTALAGAMRFTGSASDPMLRLRAPQSLAEIVMLYPVPTNRTLGARPQVSQGSPNFPSPLQQAGSPLNASFAGDAFSAVFFNPSSRTAPEGSLLDNNTRE
jgi:filamentous hemagglutinin family protein